MADNDTVTSALEPLPWQSSVWNRLARQLQEDNLAHALMLSGARGSGKQQFARGLAALVLCDRPTVGQEEARICGECKQCHLMLAGTHADFRHVRPESSRYVKVDQVRELGELLSRSPQVARRKVVIVDTADRLNINAANALLKTLEEPTDDSVLILLHDSGETILPTIRSRCQVHRLPSPSREQGLAWVRAQVTDQEPDMADLEAVIRQYPEGPRLAWEAFTAGHQHIRGECLDALKAYMKGQCPVSQASQPFVSLGLEESLNLMLDWAHDVARLAVADQPPREPAGADMFRFLATRNPGTRIHDLAARILRLRKGLDYNINPELAVSELLMGWRELMPRKVQPGR
ncbi:DNA polymerase III subunit delta' [Marinobacteraceae bacterium S3BR75-40.1]